MDARLRLIALATLLPLSAAAAPATNSPPEVVEDLGPAEIDVSSYPPEQQRVYREILLPVYGFIRGGPARVINSPLIEIDAAGEDAERRAHPAIAADPGLVVYTRGGWRAEVLHLKNRPRCCGACPVLTRADAVALRRFLVYDSLRRKTGVAAGPWADRRRELIRRFGELRSEKKS
ncbi:MAG: hypothetical protein NUW21_06820 [Elusimicrobia bacterium]|nr:hypothetical protein [Elusimicrobiota bacterium]